MLVSTDLETLAGRGGIRVRSEVAGAFERVPAFEDWAGRQMLGGPGCEVARGIRVSGMGEK